MLMGGSIFSIATQAWKYDAAFTVGHNGLAYLGIILIGTLFAYTVFLKGTSIVGPVKGSLLASVEPVASVLLTVLVMNDIFYPIDFLGMLLIIAAVLLISIKDLISVNREMLAK